MSMKTKKVESVVIQARIQPELKQETDLIFKEIGINRSEAIKMFLNQVRLHRGLPFELKIPKAETEQIFKDTDAGKNLTRHQSLQDAFDHLKI